VGRRIQERREVGSAQPFVIAAILTLHFVVGLLVMAAGDRLGRRGFAVAAVAPLVTLIWLATQYTGVVDDGDAVTQDISWVPHLGLSFDLRLDGFGFVMVGIVSGVGLLVCLYSLSYFGAGKEGVGGLAGLVTIFAGSMLGVVLTDHLIALFIFWELTSITSYLLIGNDDRNPRARDAALSAILITGAGGLAMLAGLVLIGEAGGTYRLSELAIDPPSGSTVTAGLLLVIVGAFTKSAQVPFSGWLPGAMVAPTPISTYRHAATMVKAGVYLIALMSPLFATAGVWRPIVLIGAGITMIIGGWRALRQHDLKLLLAYGTVSQLGFMILLVGAGTYSLAQAGVVLLIAHAAFKAALFMVVGIIDHEVGTRDVRALTGFGPSWRAVQAAAIISAASMAGIPPMIGFIAKEKALDAAQHAGFGGAGWVVVAIVLGSILTVAGHDASLGVAPSPKAHTPPGRFVAPAILLTVLTVLFGLAPTLIDATVKAATVSLYPASDPASVKLWAGFNSALALSALIIAVGLLLVAAHRRIERQQSRFGELVAPLPTADQSFWSLLGGLTRSARRITAIVQNGSLPFYITVIVGVAAIGPLIPLLGEFDELPDVRDAEIELAVAGIIVSAAIGATILKRRIAAVLMLGAVGYGMAGFYVVQGAPDLALTQFAIETLATVLFVLVLRFLPMEFSTGRPAVLAPLRLAVAALVGISIFVFALVATGSRPDVQEPQISTEMLARSVPDGKGSNVVNVILVDFRGMDTLGEITVLVVAALGMVALARVARRLVAGTARTLDRLPVLDASSRLLFGSILVLSLYLLFAGHNQPGGGFVGGLTAGAAISLRYVAGGTRSVRDSVPVAPWTVLGGGLAMAATTAIVPLLMGGTVLEHAVFERDVPLLGTVKTTSALPFDIGVYLVVVGLVMMAYEAFGDEVEADGDGEGAAVATGGATT
jgi:multicomponent Na+:H+ antiporter subunit A